MRAQNQLLVNFQYNHLKIFQWLNSLKVGHKIAIGYSIVLGITILGTVSGIVLSNFYIQEATKKIEHTSEEIDFTKRLERHIFFATYYQQSLAIGLDSTQLSQKKINLFKLHIKEFKKALSEFKTYDREETNTSKPDEDIKAFSEIVARHEQEINAYLDRAENIIISLEKSFLEPNKIRELQEKIVSFKNSSVNANIQYLLVELDEFVEIVTQDSKASIDILDKALKLHFQIVFVSLSLSIITAGSLAFIIGRTISHPLKTLQFSVDKASEIIFWFDSTGKIIYVNETASKYLGYESKELLRMELDDFNLDLPINSWAKFWQEIKSQKTIKFESSIEHKIGEDSQVEIDINYLEVDDIAYGCVFARDITEHKESENTLILAKKCSESANQAKSEFIANMSHELRTPLNAVLGFTRLMNRDSNLTPRQIENLKTINRSGEHLLSLINDVLNLSKIESGQMTLNSSSFNLHRLLDSLQEMFRLKANNKGLELLIDYPPDLPQYIKTDEQKLRQVLINLLSNAIKFTKTGGVSLRVAAANHSDGLGNIKYEVEDTGQGIAREELGLLFKPFVQTASGKEFQEGTGLGLPISRKFIQLMGGDIEIESVIDWGTKVKFNIVVQLANTDEVKDEINCCRVVGLESNQPNYRILVVDDLWENREILVQLLNSVGFEVEEAENGRDAISVWSTWKPHLIWMDMRMPVLDGYQATKQIKSNFEGQSTTIIALTASAFEEQKSIIMDAGCDDYVSKPFKESTIWDKITEHLGVKFIYEENTSSSISAARQSPLILEPSALEIMPADWIVKLEQASLELKEESIAELLEQIPEEHSVLIQALQDKLDNFDFGKLLDLAHRANIS